MNNLETEILENTAASLESTGNYRVLRKFDPQRMLPANPVDWSKARLGVVLDTETTGRNEDDKIIELGMVAFAYNPDTGEIYSVLDRFNALEDPGMPIPPEASAVNHITDEMVKGQRIDDAAVQSFVEKASVVIAHNASFDRPFCERRFAFFKNLPWACSIQSVDWAARGISSNKLEFIAYRLGFFYEAHRAEMDCLALLHALNVPCAVAGEQESAAPVNALSELLVRYNQVTKKIWAVNAPYEAKDTLRDRRYFWSDGVRQGTEKAWFKEVPADKLDEEMAFLKEFAFRNRPVSLPVDSLDPFVRYSARRGATERVYR